MNLVTSFNSELKQMVTIQAKSQYQTQHGQIILITSQFCDWQYVKNCLNDNGLELSNDNHNSEMNAKLLHNALRCKEFFYCFSYCGSYYPTEFLIFPFAFGLSMLLAAADAIVAVDAGVLQVAADTRQTFVDWLLVDRSWPVAADELQTAVAAGKLQDDD